MYTIQLVGQVAINYVKKIFISIRTNKLFDLSHIYIITPIVFS